MRGNPHPLYCGSLRTGCWYVGGWVRGYPHPLYWVGGKPPPTVLWVFEDRVLVCGWMGEGIPPPTVLGGWDTPTHCTVGV